ncbi:hypothetical protein CTEN210_08202 [Chaetoceros tenuissimus]|uniref:4-hydroxyphenylpyruvate dioxygenase n=1 Tax=Chaetoceros tenuissimus TaxID=426638 RepID=A0AAD3CV65_9STRA|nr:hypothetical protein CTEN210_08202 [Chaetoceros tenuissimus]
MKLSNASLLLASVVALTYQQSVAFTSLKNRVKNFSQYSLKEQNAFPQSSTLFATIEKEIDLETESISRSATGIDVAFSHVHIYTDHIEELSIYKELEDKLNKFGDSVKDLDDLHLNIEKERELWKTEYMDQNDIPTFVPQNRDIVKQLLVGLGFRIIAIRDDEFTRNVVVTTKDPNGVQFVVSSRKNTNKQHEENIGNYKHFDSKEINTFYQEHADRQGIAVLAFEVTDGNIDALYDRYKSMHPELIVPDYKNGALSYDEHGHEVKMLEVYSYYKNEKNSAIDRGTKLRFYQTNGSPEVMTNKNPLPGLESVEAKFDQTCMAAYCDHWVSNVISRTGFLETLEETLGFTPKVDFNAGVVAAGEAQIESTVTGNNSNFVTDDLKMALTDQSQVYLPINNALNEFSHVHGFIDELGQGIQHIASRVEDLPAFVQRGNDFREITGEGFTFLKIPRSYYGVLTSKLLIEDAGLSESCANAILDCCDENAIISDDGAVKLKTSSNEISQCLQELISANNEVGEEVQSKLDVIIDLILKSRYINMYKLLGDSLTESTYLRIVRNQILVDVQGNDLLFQIFTSNILQRNAGDEAPFLEFIQRVCADCSDDGCPLVMRAGCGGFGIRNFLTLFLSIEIGKAMLEVSQAKSNDDTNTMAFAQKKVDLFTNQLHESNPILTAISDAMTKEGDALLKLNDAVSKSDDESAKSYREMIADAEKEKHENNEKLMALNAKYNDLMKSLRLKQLS